MRLRSAKWVSGGSGDCELRLDVLRRYKSLSWTPSPLGDSITRPSSFSTTLQSTSILLVQSCLSSVIRLYALHRYPSARHGSSQQILGLGFCQYHNALLISFDSCYLSQLCNAFKLGHEKKGTRVRQALIRSVLSLFVTLTLTLTLILTLYRLRILASRQASRSTLCHCFSHTPATSGRQVPASALVTRIAAFQDPG